MASIQFIAWNKEAMKQHTRRRTSSTSFVSLITRRPRPEQRLRQTSERAHTRLGSWWPVGAPSINPLVCPVTNKVPQWRTRVEICESGGHQVQRWTPVSPRYISSPWHCTWRPCGFKDVVCRTLPFKNILSKWTKVPSQRARPFTSEQFLEPIDL